MNLFFRQFGKGKAMVILHGLFGSSDNWQSLAKRFSNDFQVIVPDLRNHGQSPHAEEIDYPLMAGDLKILFGKLQLSSAVIIGHSMGGKAGMQFALAYPEMVEKLIVADIAPKAYPVHHEKYADSMLSLNLSDFKRREEIDRVLSESISNPVIRQFLMKNLARNERGSFQWKINLEALKNNLPSLGAEIISDRPFLKPVLFIAGGKSDYMHPADRDDIRTIFPYFKWVEIDSAGHWIHAEEPERFYTEVIKFINGKTE